MKRDPFDLIAALLARRLLEGLWRCSFSVTRFACLAFHIAKDMMARGAEHMGSGTPRVSPVPWRATSQTDITAVALQKRSGERASINVCLCLVASPLSRRILQVRPRRPLRGKIGCSSAGLSARLLALRALGLRLTCRAAPFSVSAKPHAVQVKVSVIRTGR